MFVDDDSSFDNLENNHADSNKDTDDNSHSQPYTDRHAHIKDCGIRLPGLFRLFKICTKISSKEEMVHEADKPRIKLCSAL